MQYLLKIPPGAPTREIGVVGLRRLIVVTGTPGVGKTTTSELVARKLCAVHINCSDLAVRKKLTIKYDDRAQSYIVDMDKLAALVKKIIRKSSTDIILEGHMVPIISGFEPSIVIVPRCHPKLLALRMKQKRYAKRKIAENVAAEVLDVCLKEATDSYGIKKTYELDVTGKGRFEVASSMLMILKGKKALRHRHVDWIQRLESENKLEEILVFIESGSRLM